MDQRDSVAASGRVASAAYAALRGYAGSGDLAYQLCRHVMLLL